MRIALINRIHVDFILFLSRNVSLAAATLRVNKQTNGKINISVVLNGANKQVYLVVI